MLGIESSRLSLPKRGLILPANLRKPVPRRASFRAGVYGSPAGRPGASIPTTDPYFSSVVLLVHNDNPANGSTTVTDQSASAKAVTAFGNAAYSTAQAPTGMSSSWLLDGSGDYATLADSADWNMGTGTWTAELFIRFVGVVGYQVFFSQGATGADPGLSVYKVTAGGGMSLIQGTSDVSRAWVPTTGVWYYVAAVNDGSVCKLYVDGVQIGADIAKQTIPDSAATMRIGTETTSYLNGYMGPLRLTKGVARTISGIPTLPFPTS